VNTFLASGSEIYLRAIIKTYVRARAFGQIWKASEQCKDIIVCPT
jgi:hypothetical protein